MRELRDLYDEFGNKTELTYYKGATPNPAHSSRLMA